MRLTIIRRAPPSGTDPSYLRTSIPGRAEAFSLLELTVTLVTASVVMGGLLLLFHAMMVTDQISHRAVSFYYVQQFGPTKINERLAQATKIRAPDLTAVSGGKIGTVITYNRVYYDDSQPPPDPPPSSPPPVSPTRLLPNYTFDYSLTGVIFMPLSGSSVWLLEHQPPGGSPGLVNNNQLLAGYIPTSGGSYRTTWRDSAQASLEAPSVWTFIAVNLTSVDTPALANPSDFSVHLEKVSGNVASLTVQANTGPFTSPSGSDVYAADYTMTFRDPESISMYE